MAKETEVTVSFLVRGDLGVLCPFLHAADDLPSGVSYWTPVPRQVAKSWRKELVTPSTRSQPHHGLLLLHSFSTRGEIFTNVFFKQILHIITMKL